MIRLIYSFLLFSILPIHSFSQKAIAVHAISITVKDLGKSLDFYTKVLPFKHIGTEEFYGTESEMLMNQFGIRYKIAHLQLGEEYIDLIDYLTPGGRSIPETQKSNDLSFQHIAIVVRDMDKAFAWLAQHPIEYVSTAPQTIPATNKAAAGVRAFYFHDPDNHNLELIYFPKGKGDPRWQKPGTELFLGIDHSAIGISQTDSSLRFWQNLLGLVKKGESHNSGTEQAHLNNVENAELLITGLGAKEKGIGVEFLQYIQPGPGQPYPMDTRCDDLWNWFIRITCDDATLLYQQLQLNQTWLVSKQIVNQHGVQQFIARDPDGHAIWFTSKK